MKYLKAFVLLWSILLLVGCSRGDEKSPDGLRVPESPLLRYFESKSGRILYLGLDGNLRTVDEAGEEEIQLTLDGNLYESSPDFRGYTRFAWAPDSEKIAFVSIDHEKFTVNTIQADGTNPVQNYSGVDGSPIFLSWTPNGQIVSFLTNHWSPGGSEMAMHYFHTEGETALHTLGRGEAYFWVWEPGGNSQILAHVAREEQSRVLIVSTDKAQETVLKVPPGTFQTPAWSPDGTQLLLSVQERESTQNQLVITDLQGVIQTRLAQVGNSTAFGWSPDGKQIAYIASDRKWGGPVGPLTVQNLDNAGEKITVDDPFIHAFFWSPDSEKLAYFTLDVANGDLTSESTQGFSSLITLYVLDTENGERKNLLSFYPTVPFMDVLQHFDQYQTSASFWSPDSENMVVSAYAEGGESAVIVVVPASGNIQPRQIAEGLLAFWSSK